MLDKTQATQAKDIFEEMRDAHNTFIAENPPVTLAEAVEIYKEKSDLKKVVSCFSSDIYTDHDGKNSIMNFGRVSASIELTNNFSIAKSVTAQWIENKGITVYSYYSYNDGEVDCEAPEYSIFLKDGKALGVKPTERFKFHGSAKDFHLGFTCAREITDVEQYAELKDKSARDLLNKTFNELWPNWEEDVKEYLKEKVRNCYCRDNFI